MNIKGLAARTLFVAVACLAIVAPAASARPIPNAPFHTATPAVVAQGGFDWVTAAIVAAALAGVLGLIWLAAAAISRVTRPRAVHH